MILHLLKKSFFPFLILILSFSCQDISTKEVTTKEKSTTKEPLINKTLIKDSTITLTSKKTLPIPIWEEDNDRYEHLENYIKLLKDADFKATLNVLRNEENEIFQSTIFLPSNKWEELFLITKKLFFIPDSYPFPTKEKEIHSTPDAPSENAINSPYDYVDQYFECLKDNNGKVKEIKYFNSNEVGTQVISIIKEENGFIITAIEQTQ